MQWVKVFVKWSGLRHPRDMGGPEIEAFLTMLATERRVAASTPKRIPSVLTTAEVTALLAALPAETALI